MTEEAGPATALEVDPEPGVARAQPRPYPGIARAIGLLAVLFVIQVLFMIPTAVVGLSSHPGVIALVNMGAAAVILAWALRRTGASFPEVFPLRAVRPASLLALTVAVIGLSIVLSEVDNTLRSVLPPPASFAQLMRDLTGGQKSLWGSILAISIVAPLWEEALFRGVILRGFLQRYGVRTAIVVSAVLFAAFHLNPWQFAGAATAGLLLGWCYVRTGSLVPCVLGHAVNNSLGFLVMAVPFEIPGYTAGLTDTVQHQPLWFDALGVLVAIVGLLWLRRSLASTGTAASEAVSSGPPGAIT